MIKYTFLFIAAVAVVLKLTRAAYPAYPVYPAQFGDISLSFFPGLCRYGSNEVDSIGTFGNINANACHQICKNTNGCTAFAVDAFQSCVLYRGGPYTKGDGYSGIRCYILKKGSFKWGYGADNGPSKWGNHFPKCSAGKNQSPINLPEKTSGSTVNYPSIEFSSSYSGVPAVGKLSNNGHTVVFNANMPNSFSIKSGPYGFEEYQFLQLHFHWGSINSQGSEHTINGASFPMEMHMVHVNSKYVKSNGTLDSAFLSARNGLAVLGVMFELGNQDYAPLANVITGINAINSATTRRATSGSTHDIQLNLGSFVTSSSNNGYYTYNGSLTTPSCNEVVTWVNFKKAIVMSHGQLASFRSLKDVHGAPLVDNFRPVQPLNGRAIGDGNQISDDSSDD